MRRTDPEWSSRGLAHLPEETVEVLCDALDCLYNDKSREAAASEGFCTLASVMIRKSYCACYKMDKEWMRYTLKQSLNRVFFPEKFFDKTTWSEQ